MESMRLDFCQLNRCSGDILMFHFDEKDFMPQKFYVSLSRIRVSAFSLESSYFSVYNTFYPFHVIPGFIFLFPYKQTDGYRSI